MRAGLQRPSLTVRQECYKQLGKKKKAVGGTKVRRDKDMEEHALFTSSKPITA